MRVCIALKTREILEAQIIYNYMNSLDETLHFSNKQFRWFPLKLIWVFLLFERERDIFPRTLVYGVYVFKTYLKFEMYNVSSIISFLKL